MYANSLKERPFFVRRFLMRLPKAARNFFSAIGGMLCLPFKYQEDKPKDGCRKPQLFKSDMISMLTAAATLNLQKKVDDLFLY
jgi:hypothetical protein